MRKIPERTAAGIKIGEMRRLLSIFDQDADLYIEGLTFFRFKGIGTKLVAMEFNEAVVARTSETAVMKRLHRREKRRTR